MKTAIQEHIEFLERELDLTNALYSERRYGKAYAQIFNLCLDHAKSLLEKEKEQMCEFQDKAQYTDFWIKYDGAEDCFDKTFNNEEK